MLGTGCVAESLQQRSSSSNIGSRSGSAVCISYSLVLVVVVVTVVVVAINAIFCAKYLRSKLRNHTGFVTPCDKHRCTCRGVFGK